MTNLLHLLMRQWRERPVRTLLSVFSVSLAVAAVLGTQIGQSSVRSGTKRLLESVEGRPALEILLTSGGRFPTVSLPDLKGVSGISGWVPVASRGTMVRVHGKRLRSVVIGVPPGPAAIPVESGGPLEKPDDVLLSADVAKSLNLGLGDSLTVLTRRGARQAKIVGLADPLTLRDYAPGATLVMPLATVQEFFGLEDQIDRLRISVASSDDIPRVQAAIAAQLPETLIVQAPARRMELADSMLLSIEMALQFAGALSVAMATFIILNTLRMNFGERRRDMAVVRVLGATSRQIAGLHLLEGFCLGLAGSALGVPLGMWLGHGLGRVLAIAMGSAAAPPGELPLLALATAVVLGPLVACVAALIPAIQSRKVSPVEALGDLELRSAERYPIWAVACGMAAWSAACVVLVMVWTERLPPDLAIPAGLLMLVGFIVVIPAVLGPLVHGIVACLGRLLKIEGGLAGEQLLRRPMRTGLTVGVLVVAVSTCLGLGNAIVNNVNDARAWFRRTMTGDLVLSDPSIGDPGAAVASRDKLAEQIAANPDVDYVIEMHHLPIRANGFPALCVVRNFAPQAELPWVLDSESEVRVRTQLAAGEGVMASVLSRKLGLHAGDTLRLEAQGRIVSVHIAEVVNDYWLGGMAVYLDHAVAKGLIDLGPANVYIVQGKSNPAAIKQQLAEVAEQQGLVLNSFAELREQIDQLINGVVGALWGLLAVGFVIGGVAVANTLTMSVLEQTREIGLLRVVGMTRRQVRRLVLCESLLLGIVGILMGTLAGTVTALVIHWGNVPLLGRAIPFAFHPWLIAISAGGGLIVAMLAAWSPGVRAARMNLLTAIAYE